MSALCLNAAVVGIGGFAGAHHTSLIDLENAGLVKVVATCDPLAGELEERRLRYRLDERGVSIHPDFDSLLRAHGSSLDLVTVASPIRFHAEHHRACVDHDGIACYLEKPPTLDPEELETMIVADTNARAATQAGFNYISQPWRQKLKERILRGEFGRLRRVEFKGLWRRSLAYYGRNSWVGRLFLGDYILLDSCCGNAMSHFVHNLLFHAGLDGLMSWAEANVVEAELYRANQIEGADTVFARGALNSGVEFLLAASHACEPTLRHLEVLQCDEARIEIPESGPCVIRRRDGSIETVATMETSLKENLGIYREYLLGMRSRPVTTLPDCRPFVRFDALLYLAAGQIHTVASDHVVPRRVAADSRETICISDIDTVCEDFLRTGKFPSESSVPWASAGGKSTANELVRLRPALERLREHDRMRVREPRSQ